MKVHVKMDAGEPAVLNRLVHKGTELQGSWTRRRLWASMCCGAQGLHVVYLKATRISLPAADLRNRQSTSGTPCCGVADEGRWNTFKRIGRHSRSRPLKVSSSPWQRCTSWRLHSNKDWAACERVRRSTSGGTATKGMPHLWTLCCEAVLQMIEKDAVEST